MYIEPNSTIIIYHNVPIDATYDHTIYWDSKNAQESYFTGNTDIIKYRLSNQSYQRVMKGKMRIAIKSDNLYDCNYLAFQNTAFGNKWFYAFITGVEYVNNETSEVTFEIDVMQTYFFAVTLEHCFVEREHSVTDEVGENIVSETVETGDIKCLLTQKADHFDTYTAIMTSSLPQDDIPGGYVCNMFTGLNFWTGDVEIETDRKKLLDYLAELTNDNKSESILSIYMFPTYYTYTSGTRPKGSYTQYRPSAIGDYTPRNKKLLTYPYNYLNVECGNNNAIYRYEWFADPDNGCLFNAYSTIVGDPQIALVPVAYNGYSVGQDNYTEKLVMDSFPQCGWSIDSYRAWIAQHGSSNKLQALGSIGAVGASVAGSGGTLAPAVAVAGIMGIGNAINSDVVQSTRPPQAKGTDSGSIDVSTRNKAFYFQKMQIQKQYAMIIDDYFDMFGYATRRVKVPNRNSRPHWNYVKTQGCNVRGNAPADDVKKICSIYDSGITFWKNPEEIGNYGLDNRPAS